MLKEAQGDGSAGELRPRMMKVRKDHEDRIEALRSDAQKEQWKEMPGKP